MFPKCGTTSLFSKHDTADSTGEAQTSTIQEAVCHTIITNEANPHNYNLQNKVGIENITAEYQSVPVRLTESI
jgi:hypothetical protein